MDYKKAGVDIEAGYRSVELMKEHVKKTMRPEVLGGLGGLFLLGIITRRGNTFGALCGIAASIIVQILVARSGYVHLLLYSTTGFLSCFIIGYLASLCIPGNCRDIKSLTIYGKQRKRP